MGENYKIVRIEANKSFFKRHGILISSLGAIVVLGTFILKDAIRENLKTLVDSVDSAQTLYTIRRDISVLREDLMPLILDTDSMNDTDNKTKDTKSSQIRELRALKNGIKAQIDDDETALSSVVDLGKKIDQGKEAEDAKMKLYHELHAKMSALDALIHPGDYEDDDFAIPAKPVVALQIKGIKAIYDDLGKIEKREVNMIEETVSLSNEIKKQRERRYEICTWASYVLYVCGWSLAFIGRIYGVEAGASE